VCSRTLPAAGGYGPRSRHAARRRAALLGKALGEIFRIILDFKQEGRTILLVEQNARKALQCADRGYVLETGTMVLSGSGAALLDSQEVQAAYLGGRT